MINQGFFYLYQLPKALCKKYIQTKKTNDQSGFYTILGHTRSSEVTYHDKNQYPSLDQYIYHRYLYF